MWVAVFLNYFICVDVLSACISDVPGALHGQKKITDPLELELMVAVSCHVVLGPSESQPMVLSAEPSLQP